MILVLHAGLVYCSVWFDTCYSLPVCSNHMDEEMSVGNGKNK